MYIKKFLKVNNVLDYIRFKLKNSLEKIVIYFADERILN